ncbi:glycosyltransferase family 2 protein [Brachyspira pilosicoli]|uniref:glycosyltransferase family 2 protein n=1 Tax=Brachyspira pilosicoli TaxID=52584 RepID=UPI0012F4DA21|nr:glycosyltransferase family 2 protein [Brachyspira pilosicoli]
MKVNITKNKIGEYKKSLFFEKKNKDALLIVIINKGKSFIYQINKIKKIKIFDICDGENKYNFYNPNFIKEYIYRELIINISTKKVEDVESKKIFYKTMINSNDDTIMVDSNDKSNIHKDLLLFFKNLKESHYIIQYKRFSLSKYKKKYYFSIFVIIKLILSTLISIILYSHYNDMCNRYKGFSKNYILDKKIYWFRNKLNTYEYCYYILVHIKKLEYKFYQLNTIRVYTQNEIPSKIKGILSNFKLFKKTFNLDYSNISHKLIYALTKYIIITTQNTKNYNLCAMQNCA